MRIYFTRSIKKKEVSKPFIERYAFGDSLRYSIEHFFFEFLPKIGNSLSFMIRHDNFSEEFREVKFTITLKF